MGKIVLLDDLTINKIAAGEVIERPASVVKEMVENSIDAGATKITVEIKNGGISFIRISDNGKGIAEDDMEIAFERHATSKIRVADDIIKVTSMGFRGEALASIAAIANVEMISRTADSSIGHKIVVEGGKVIETSEIGAPIGTTITVKNLFYNTPVRYKFLKKDYTESGYIEDAISRLALVNKNISFKLINTGKTVIQTNGNDDEQSVIYSIYGKDIAENIIEVNKEYEGITVSGVVGKPEIARSNRSNQLFFVNGRFVKDRTLTAATEQAFKNEIPANKYGFVILNVQMNPEKLDVNVHPAKLEVRFEDENEVFKAVYSSIKDALATKEIEKEEKKSEETIFETKKLETITEDIEQKSDEVAKAIREDELFGKKNKLSFFKRNKEDDSKDEEEKDNLLEEVYKFRKGLKEIGVSEVPTSVYTPIFEEQLIQEEQSKANNIEEKDVAIEEKREEGQEQGQEKEEETENIIVNDEEESTTQEEKANITTPSESKVQEMTAELIKQRESNEILEEAIENSKKESHIEPEENIDDANDNQFNDMYTKIFGDKPAVRQDEYEKVLSENEQKMLEEIKNSVRPVPKIEETEVNKAENKIDEEKAGEVVEEKIQEETNDSGSIENTVDNIEQEPELEEKQPEIEKNNSGEQQSLIQEDITQKISEFKSAISQNYKFVGIAFSNYIIVEIEDEMCIIDWKAANEKIIFEKLKRDYHSREKDSQTMLMADIIVLNHKQTEAIKENLELFENAGFALEAFGENTIKLTEVPNVCIDMNTKHLFLELLDGIDEYPKNSNYDKENRFIAEIAKKVADVSDIKISEREVDRVLSELLKLEDPYTDGKGKSIAFEMTKYDIERKFSRK